jgi:hypothetical protein
LLFTVPTNSVQHDEAEIPGRTEFKKVQRADERVTHGRPT